MKKRSNCALLNVFLLSILLVSACQSPVTHPVASSSPASSSSESGITGSPIPGGNLSTSNGRSIYFDSIDASGERIGNSGGPGGMMQGSFSCVNCHGSEGHGGTVNFMMRTFDVPDITWPTLTGHYEDHQPFTDETVKQAISQGVDPAGNALEYPMPRWQMSSQDLNDLVSFIKTLK